MTISSSKSHFLFIAFLDSHPIIGAGEVQLGKSLCTFQLIKGFTNKWEQIPILNDEVVKALVVNTNLKAPIGFLVK